MSQKLVFIDVMVSTFSRFRSRRFVRLAIFLLFVRNYKITVLCGIPS